MNILFLTESTEPTSGWGRYASSLIQLLRAQGVRVTVLTAEAPAEGPRLPGIHAGRVAWWFAGIRLRAWLLTRRFDVIHVAVEHYARLFHAFGRMPFVVTVHGTYADPRAQGPAWAVRDFTSALRRAARVVAVSAFTAAHLPERVRGRATVIPNGVDLGIVGRPFEAVRAMGHPLVLAAGTLKPRKGYDRLIRGFALFRRNHPEAELAIVGSDADREVRAGLERLASELNLSAAVRITGAIPDAELLGWYRACDLFALTPVSDAGFEGFGLVYLEANAFGKPAVGARGSGAAEAIIEGKSGVLVNAEEPSDVAAGMERALLLRQDAVLETAKAFSWDRRADDLLRVYRAAASSAL